MEQKTKLLPLEKSWILYDVGNSAFVLLVTTLLPIYFNALAGDAGVSASNYLAYWGYAGSAATLLVALIGPICGTLADQKDFKKPIFLVCLGLGAFSCVALAAVRSWLVFLVVFVVAKVGFNASLVPYDAMLPEVTSPGRMDRVSAMGYAFGYIGSVIPFIACLGLVLGAGRIGLSTVTAMGIAFLLTAVWWLALSAPLLLRYRQTAFVDRRDNPVSATFRQLGKTLGNVRREPHIFLYLLAFFFFIDGVYTIIDMATAYGMALGLDSTGLLLALLVTQVVAFPFALLFGALSERFDTGFLIKLCILAYTGIALYAVFLRRQWQFWLLAVLVGMFQGGIQALSRSYLGKIIPAEHSGEYFGLMDICGKGASFMGTTLVAGISQFTHSESLGVGTLVVVFLAGFFLFCKADAQNQKCQR